MNFYICIHSCNCLPDKDTEYFHYPRRLPCLHPVNTYPTPFKTSTILISVNEGWPCPCFFLAYKLNCINRYSLYLFIMQYFSKVHAYKFVCQQFVLFCCLIVFHHVNIPQTLLIDICGVKK